MILPSIETHLNPLRSPTTQRKTRDPFFDDDSDQDTEEALIRLAIAESILENANKIPDQDAAVAFSPYARFGNFLLRIPFLSQILPSFTRSRG